MTRKYLIKVIECSWENYLLFNDGLTIACPKKIRVFKNTAVLNEQQYKRLREEAEITREEERTEKRREREIEQKALCETAEYWETEHYHW